MKLEEYIREKPDFKNRQNRTININSDLHLFFKRTANHYNIAISDVVHNILINWKNQYQHQIKEEILTELDNDQSSSKRKL